MRISNKNIWPLLDNQFMYSKIALVQSDIKKAIQDIEKSFDRAITKINNIEIK